MRGRGYTSALSIYQGQSVTTDTQDREILRAKTPDEPLDDYAVDDPVAPLGTPGVSYRPAARSTLCAAA